MVDGYKDVLRENKPTLDKFEKRSKELNIKKAILKTEYKKQITSMDTFLRELVSDKKLIDTINNFSIYRLNINNTTNYNRFLLHLTEDGTIECQDTCNTEYPSEEYTLKKVPYYLILKEKIANNLISECFKDGKAFVIKKPKKDRSKYLANNYDSIYNIIPILTIDDFKRKFKNNLKRAIENELEKTN
ncbi:MAG: hypothetical protein KAJ47_03225 [Candidatus Aenigmarchaeota archaeon]|nr:hypothetical protein [Candidatus Aenigmarchaeota archaeon]